MADLILKAVRQTEKGTRVAAMRQYIVEVDSSANKMMIRKAVEARFKVTVAKVNTQMMLGKWRRLTGRWGKRPDWKKAIVTLAEGQKIEVK